MRKIFVMGGGGFSMEPDNHLLDSYILSLTTKPKPKISFIATASGDSERYIENFYNGFRKHICEPSHLSLFQPHTRDIRGYILEQDIIFIGGGNTRNLLLLWKEWSLDQYLREAYERGTVMGGISAGMLCWFEQGITDSYGAGTLEPISCLGWLKGSACPHFDGEANRRPRYTELLREGRLDNGIALDDSVGALYVNEQLTECVSSVFGKQGFLFKAKTVEETRLNVTFLGK